MFFGKTERKKSSFGPILVVGALAIIGAMSITQKGKAIIKSTANKMKNAVGKCDCEM